MMRLRGYLHLPRSPIGALSQWCFRAPEVREAGDGAASAWPLPVPGHATRQRQIERAHARTKLQHDTGNNRRGTDSMQAGGWINARFKTDVAGLGSNGRRSVGFNPAALEV
eukprot:2113086-Rhodomonas_salina.5